MNTTNLRPEAGGDPAQSNSTDLKNDPEVTRDRNDFPDAPGSEPDAKPQDKPDLDAFAAKLGTDTIESGEGLHAVPDRDVSDSDVSDPHESDSEIFASNDDATDPRPIFAGAAAVAGLIGLVVWRRQRTSRLTRFVETIDVFN